MRILLLLTILCIWGCKSENIEQDSEPVVSATLSNLNTFSIDQWRELMGGSIRAQLKPIEDTNTYAYLDYLEFLSWADNQSEYLVISTLKVFFKDKPIEELYIIKYTEGGIHATDHMKVLIRTSDSCSCAFAYIENPGYDLVFNLCDTAILNYIDLASSNSPDGNLRLGLAAVYITKIDPEGLTCKAIFKPTEDQWINMSLDVHRPHRVSLGKDFRQAQDNKKKGKKYYPDCFGDSDK